MRKFSPGFTSMRIKAITAAGLMAAMMLLQSAPVAAQGIKVRVGRTIGGSGFHIPSYVAMDKGLFKAEGLEVEFVSTPG
ncbi:MAG: hypothetical protein AABZ69_01970, partial [Candidatus Binatota bacterium]